MGLLANVPTLSYVQWKNLLITHKGTTYQIENSHTNKPYIYWDSYNPYLLITSNIKLDARTGLFYIIFNESGKYTVVPNDDITMNFSENPSREAITDRIIGLSNDTKDQFVAVQIEIDGVKTTVAKCQEDISRNQTNISTLEQTADRIDMEVKQVTVEFNNDVEMRELRDSVSSGLLALQATLGLFSADMNEYMSDNRPTDEEKNKINTYKQTLKTDLSNLKTKLNPVFEILRENNDTEKTTRLNSSVSALETAINNLLTNIDTVLTDNVFTNTEVVAVVTYFGKASTAITELKNLIDQCISLALGGNLIEEIGSLTVRHNSVASRVTTSEGHISEVEQTANKINWVVKSGTSASNMQLTSEAYKVISNNITLEADQVNLTGYVTISNLASAGKTTVNGGNITTGTIDASKATITNINASNIKTGTLSGDFITGGTIKGTLLQTDATNSNLGVRITKDSLLLDDTSFWYSDSNTFRVQSKDNLAISCMGTYITLTPGLRQDGSPTNTGIVTIPNALLQAQRLRVIDNSTLEGTLTVSGKLTCGSFSTSGAISATSFTATSGGFSGTGNISTSGGTISGVNGSFSGTLNVNGAFTGAGAIELSTGSFWTPLGTTSKEYIKIKNVYLSSDAQTQVVDGKNVTINRAYLTDTNGSWVDLYAKTIYSNQTALTSDARLKTDIKYVNIDTQSISKESGLMTPNVNITTQDMHEFVETLPLVSYRMIEDIESNIDDTYYGFLAQEILYTKVGSELIKTQNIVNKDGEEDVSYRYSENKFVSFIAGALQEEIQQRKEQIEDLNNTIIKLEEKIKDLEDKTNK